MRENQNPEAPFFTVVTCTFNRAGLIRRALDSLVAQECPDWECVIVDDASTDDTREVVTPYLGSRVRYLYHDHQGCAMSKNTGLSAARGRYVTFLDSDDEYRPEHLRIRKEVLERERDIDLLHSDVDVVGNAFVPDRDDPSRLIPIAECVVGGTFVLRREAALAVGGFPDVPLGDDAGLMARFLTGGYKIKKIASATYVYYRDTPDSMCTDQFSRPS